MLFCQVECILQGMMVRRIFKFLFQRLIYYYQITIKKFLTGYWQEYHLKKPKPFNTDIEPTISNLAKGRVILNFNNSVLRQKNSFSLYRSFILNLYIVYELNNLPRNPMDNLLLKNCLFITVKLVRNEIKSKFIYNG